MGRKLVACMITVAGLLYMLYVAWRYYGFRGYALYLLTGLLVVNGPFVAFGSWGWFTYAFGLVLSAVLIPLAACLHDYEGLTLRRQALIGLGLALLVLQSIRLILPISIVLSLFWLYHAVRPPRSWLKAGRLTGSAAVMGAPAVGVAAYLLLFWAHTEFVQPRDELWRFYFPLSGAPRTISGAFRFWVVQGLSLARTLWAAAPRHAGSIHAFRVTSHQQDVSGLMVLFGALFVVGLLSSLARTRRREFILGALVLLTWVAVSVMGLLGLYAYGHVRHFLFAFLPVMFCCALGARATGVFAAGLLQRFLRGPYAGPARTALKTALFLVVVAVTVHLQYTLARNVAHISRSYNARWLNVMSHIDEAPRDALVWDFYTQLTLEAARPGIDYGEQHYFGRSFARHYDEHEEDLSEWLAFLARHDCITAVTYWDFFEGDADFHRPVSAAFEVVRLPSMLFWNVYRFERRAVEAPDGRRSLN